MGDSHITFDHWEGRYANRVSGIPSSATRDLFGAASRDDMISLSGGMPDIRIMPKEVLSEALNSMLDNKDAALQYGSTDGRTETKEIIISLMQDIGVNNLAPEDIIITSGSQQALDLIGKVFINPGDTIITEAPSYLGALQAFSAYQPNFRSVPFDEHGMRMDLLEELLEELGYQGAKFLYTIPTFQNPGGVTMSLERRKRLIELCHAYDITIVEDDPYSRLRFEGEPVASLRSLDPDVVYLGTFSKIFAPGLRVAWMIAPRAILQKINLCKQGADLCGSAFNQILVEKYFTLTPWKETLAKYIEAYKKRRDAILAACEEYLPKEVQFTHPQGGFFIWLTLPEYINTTQLLPIALDRGVTFVPGSGCYPDHTSNSMRLAFCYESEQDLNEGVKRIAKVIDERLIMYRALKRDGLIVD